MSAKPLRQSIGQQGEALAADYLRAKGCTIVTTNWRCQQGELDIVARTGTTLVFVEVRTRRAETNDNAFASVLTTKRKRLIAAVHLYLQAHDLQECDWRVDVIAVALRRRSPPLIEQVEDALEW